MATELFHCRICDRDKDSTEFYILAGTHQGQKRVADLVTPAMRAKWDRELGIKPDGE